MQQSTYQHLQTFLGSPQPPGTLLTAVQQFLLDRDPNLSPASLIHLYRSLIAHGRFLNNPPLHAISPNHIAAYAEQLRAHYSPGTIRPIIGDLKQFYAWLHITGQTPHNYGARLRKPRPPQRKHHAEETAMLALIEHLAQQLRPFLYRDVFGNLTAQEDNWGYEQYKTLHDLTALVFLYETGSRAGELCNVSSRQMSQVLATPGPAYAITCYGKTNDRTYRFAAATAELCRLWLAKRPFSVTWLFVSWRRGHSPTKLQTAALGQMLARRCRQANLPPFRPHSIRHAKVIRSRKLIGLDLTSRLIDHASIATTRAYDYVDNDELSAAAAQTGLTRHLW